MNLKEARKNAALSQRELSKASGIAHSTLSGLETGKRKAQFPARRAICKALHIKPSDIDW